MSKILDRKFISNLRHSIKSNNFERLRVFLESEKKGYMIHINKFYNIFDKLLNIIDIDNKIDKYKHHVSFLDFHNNIPKYKISRSYIKSVRIKEYIKVFEYIAKNYSELIREKHIEKAVEYNAKPIYDILIKYFNEDDIDDSCDKCCLCFSTIQVQLINNICSCKNKIHYYCLTDLVKQYKKSYCTVCLTPYKHVIDYDNNLFFPYSGIYPQISQKYKTVFIDKNNKKIQLYYAIAYLIVPKVREILDEISKEEFYEYINGIDFDQLHKYIAYDYDPSSWIYEYEILTSENSKYVMEFNEIKEMLLLKNT